MMINPLKEALVTLIGENRNALGIRTVAKDIALDNIAEDADKLIAAFPAVIVAYFGRSSKREGTRLILSLQYAIVVVTRSLKGPNASEPIAADLLDPLLSLIQGRNLVPTIQRSDFDYRGENLVHKDKVMTIYQQLFETDVGVDFRSELGK